MLGENRNIPRRETPGRETNPGPSCCKATMLPTSPLCRFYLSTVRLIVVSGAFTMIPPNQSRRSEIKAVAQKEEEELQRWKETHKPPPLQLNPERLGGGDVTLAEARQRQFTDLKCFKIQKKLKKEDMDKKRRQEEEEELQKMKAKQREKSEYLKKMREQEDEKRREQLHQDHIRGES
ncbi:hypothetical protein AMECASPLE_025471 [Ameca splendens]|uniref:Epithelial-stromal interaction protein 1 n=1 Tax=Ameca splendens TaxID=208324 RepID=A0ABV0ZPJ1_9TELE